MKCLMIKPWFVVDILEGFKTVEYRTWSTKYRGDFFIGSSSTEDTRSYLAAVASLDDITFNEEDNIYEWHLSNVREIKPIPIRGQLRLFECGIDDYEELDNLTEEECDAVWAEAEKWISKKGKFDDEDPEESVNAGIPAIGPHGSGDGPMKCFMITAKEYNDRLMQNIGM